MVAVREREIVAHSHPAKSPPTTQASTAQTLRVLVPSNRPGKSTPSTPSANQSPMLSPNTSAIIATNATITPRVGRTADLHE